MQPRQLQLSSHQGLRTHAANTSHEYYSLFANSGHFCISARFHLPYTHARVCLMHKAAQVQLAGTLL